MWSVIAILGIARLIDAANLRCYLDSRSQFAAVPLDRGAELLNNPCYNSSCITLSYEYGYRGQNDGPTTIKALDAMFELKNLSKTNSSECYNVMMLDWQEEASSPDAFGEVAIKLAYATKAVPNSIAVAQIYCKTIIEMIEKYNFDIDKMICIGFSLGAHICGYLGRCLNANGLTITRIIGIDSAGPLFGDMGIFLPLDKTCAKFVLNVRTDPGGFGMNSSTGDVDSWANYRNFINGTDQDHVQPACQKGKFPFMSEQDLCSHNFGIELLVTMLKYLILIASKALNIYEWEAGNTSTNITLGLHTDPTASGNHYFRTSGTPPYGLGAEGSHP